LEKLQKYFSEAGCNYSINEMKKQGWHVVKKEYLEKTINVTYKHGNPEYDPPILKRSSSEIHRDTTESNKSSKKVS